MSALMQQHSRYQAARERLWYVPAKRPVIPPPVPREPSAEVAAPPVVVLPNWAPFNFLQSPGPRALVKLVALRHRISVDEILGTRRQVAICAARHEAVFLVYTHCQHMSLPEIGRIFSRDHTTILHSVRTYRAKMERANG